MTIRAIETRYKGYRFRSRLEARWAVFFDAVEVEYLYEHEGFELPSGRYLPDFYLPGEKCFVEIKPERPSFEELKLALELCEASKKSVYIFFGDPVSCFAPDFPGMLCCESSTNESLSFLFLKDYEAAALKARQARFEHGEVGA